jgi:hypothetical protein
MTRMTSRAAIAAAVGALSLAASMAPAVAGRPGTGGSTDGNSVEASAEIHVTGDVKGGGGGGGSVTASAPAICWWEKSDVSGEGIEAIAAVFKTWFGIELDQSALDQMKKDEEAGKKFEWYERKTREGASKAELEAAGCNDYSGPYKGLFIGLLVRPFEPGEAPEPIPDPEEMADVALENIELQAPTLSWNPKAEALGGGTLVNLPTWFWVTNPGPAVGDGTGERSVTATAAAGDSEVSVTVTATADKLQIASPGGATTCTVDQARTAYAKGAAESSACTLTFERASTKYPSGFPVRATVAWSASWTGTGPGVPGGVQPLEGVVLSSTTDVPVREAQTIVKQSS